MWVLGRYVAAKLWLELGRYVATKLWLKLGRYVETELWLDLVHYVATEPWLELGRYIANDLGLSVVRLPYSSLPVVGLNTCPFPWTIGKNQGLIAITEETSGPANSGTRGQEDRRMAISSEDADPESREGPPKNRYRPLRMVSLKVLQSGTCSEDMDLARSSSSTPHGSHQLSTDGDHGVPPQATARKRNPPAGAFTQTAKQSLRAA
ncbi:hypothetical protein F2Q69_00021674 [Brassica cretica]|uniref:Uncharacterized protein n=1 Tax=Brassica cretica TaxID=69181 RepID=A0A8S9QMN7_BRACR|nr:hypothetical protein F2Q69_00021674 [Brassica cretica]